MLNESQVKEIKQQLLKQLENFPPEQAGKLREQIESMSPSELEEFLAKNNLTSEKQAKSDECVFCSIIKGKVPGYKVDENKSSLALLEINPLSRGHSLVVSKQHNKLPSSSFTLANKIAKRIKSKFKAEDVKIENTKITSHNIIQVIPLYKGQELKKSQASEKELILLQDKLKAKPKVKKVKKIVQETTIENLPKAPKRVP